MSEIFTRNKVKNIIIVTGTFCSGKSLISPIIASLYKIDLFNKFFFIENLFSLRFLKKIPIKSLIFLINSIIENKHYENLIGRHLNFRIDDETSIWNSPNAKNLFLRIFENKNFLSVKKKLFGIGLNLDIHDAVRHYDVWKNLNKNIKIINIFRHPVDVIFSLYKHKFGELEKNPLNQLPLYQDEDLLLVPYYFYKKTKIYNSSSRLEKCFMLAFEMIMGEIRFIKKYNKNQLIRVNFDKFVTETDKSLKKILSFLKTKKTKNTNYILKREGCYRVINFKERDKKLNFIKKNLSKKFHKDFFKLIEKYQRNENL